MTSELGATYVGDVVSFCTDRAEVRLKIDFLTSGFGACKGSQKAKIAKVTRPELKTIKDAVTSTGATGSSSDGTTASKAGAKSKAKAKGKGGHKRLAATAGFNAFKGGAASTLIEFAGGPSTCDGAEFYSGYIILILIGFKILVTIGMAIAAYFYFVKPKPAVKPPVAPANGPVHSDNILTRSSTSQS
jgi:hypothetical protein